MALCPDFEVAQELPADGFCAQKVGMVYYWSPEMLASPRSMTASLIFGALAFSCAACPAAQAAHGHFQLEF